ncbi:MAG TPA: hypothetical protein VK463_10855 [Desulfomonilaceae bacterium]|nr:hypothetical protein [Desulfomonilaceae bacterium]
MFTEWDERFDLLIGANIQDENSEPCLDSGVHDLLHGQTACDAEGQRFSKRPVYGCRSTDHPSFNWCDRPHH